MSRLSDESLRLIQRQAMAPTWTLDGQARRVVEAKAETKRRIGRSPDDADALNLAFAVVPRLETDDALWAEIWRPREEGGERPGGGWWDDPRDWDVDPRMLFPPGYRPRG